MSKQRVSASARRTGVQFLLGRGLSLRQAGRSVGSARASLRYQPRPRHDAARVERFHESAAKQPRSDARRAWAVVRREPGVNHQRVYRLWRHTKRPLKRRTHQRLGATAHDATASVLSGACVDG